MDNHFSFDLREPAEKDKWDAATITINNHTIPLDEFILQCKDPDVEPIKWRWSDLNASVDYLFFWGSGLFFMVFLFVISL